MTIERITELEWFIDREMKGNEALTNDPGCVARAKIDRDILACLKELQAHREAWEKVLDEMMNASIPGQDAEYVYENIYDIIKKYRPKEGDAE